MPTKQKNQEMSNLQRISSNLAVNLHSCDPKQSKQNHQESGATGGNCTVGELTYSRYLRIFVVDDFSGSIFRQNRRRRWRRRWRKIPHKQAIVKNSSDPMHRNEGAEEEVRAAEWGPIDGEIDGRPVGD